MNRTNPVWRKSHLEAIGSHFNYFVFLSTNKQCNGIGISGFSLFVGSGTTGGTQSALKKDEAERACTASGCECALAIDSGSIKDERLLLSWTQDGASSGQVLVQVNADGLNRIRPGVQSEKTQAQPANEQAERERIRIAAELQRKTQELAIKENERAVQERERRAAEEFAKAQQLENQRLASEVARLRAEAIQRQQVRQEVLSHRKALVIGNDSYRFVPVLNNAREDARAIADNLTRFGYSVTLKLDVSEREMKAALRVFKNQIESGDEVAFFYAGHGVQIANSNYLIPVDVAGESEDQIKDEGISLQRILDDVSEKKAKFTLALIDACRDNPFKSAGRTIGSASRGLSPTTAATGQLIIFSAGAGQRALDNLGAGDKSKNGLFTRVFIKEMQKPSVTVDRVVRETRAEVVRLAKSIGHEQVPAIYDQVVGDFYFRK